MACKALEFFRLSCSLDDEVESFTLPKFTNRYLPSKLSSKLRPLRFWFHLASRFSTLFWFKIEIMCFILWLHYIMPPDNKRFCNSADVTNKRMKMYNDLVHNCIVKVEYWKYISFGGSLIFAVRCNFNNLLCMSNKQHSRIVEKDKWHWRKSNDNVNSFAKNRKKGKNTGCKRFYSRIDAENVKTINRREAGSF